MLSSIQKKSLKLKRNMRILF